MRDMDESKLARIVAYGLFLGKSDAEIEASLYQYAPRITGDQVTAAKAEGAQLRALSANIAVGDEARAAGLMGALGFPAGNQWQVYARFAIGPNLETDWRSVSVVVPRGASPADILAATEQATADALARAAYEGIAMVPDSLSLVFVAPVL